ncbi:type I phosphomannose isomerase catalytic subunit [Selenomonas sp.]|uniref:type I phosphomannose isomerase catalytic subunit n=1 Tax=Selenomonas sp. TaxID=2053611 RepID=UPI0025D315B9|nr:type I phosphomannose isomerase catalytic subunit [Selenomonas sp.]MCI6084904.1 class I mannose-6-phosphate isomerase [Selenomonas sp.]MDY3297703.1 type I phosphomannose isomerase catalytic subunit [Selenomonas sp.]MDY4416930.1 type I phosphomannose isomerase catalytic subunit [Selenomonas sp.]
MKRYPMKLIAPLKDYLWGGTRLKDEYGKKTDLDIVAESWELACHKDGKSVIANGEASGMTLEAWLAEQKDDMLGAHVAKFPYFPLLIKLIDARGNLSVQVHPDNEYAQRVEGEYGKTEMWYIVDCEPGASLLYGFKSEITKEEFERRIQDNTLLDVCNRVPVHKGDVFFIDSGTLHAIGKGILICEIQQNSNTTYRIYDYGRVGKDGKPRELHVAKALDVTTLAPAKAHPAMKTDMDIFAGADARLLASCEYFTTYHLDVDGKAYLFCGEDSFQSFTVLAGSVKAEAGDYEVTFHKGETAFLPAGLGKYTLKGKGELILSKL